MRTKYNNNRPEAISECVDYDLKKDIRKQIPKWIVAKKQRIKLSELLSLMELYRQV